MRDRATIFAVVAALLLVGWAAAPVAAADGSTSASLSVDVTQHDDGTATVSVTETVDNNTTAVANASVTVEVTDENATYDGTGDYTTDENGTVGLPAPNETVNVTVTAESGNLTATTDATLQAVEEESGGDADAFGQEVSAFVNELQNDSNVSRIGPLVADFVVENNPGNAPDHAGPPEWLVNASENGTQGPPPWAGGPADADDGNATDEPGNGQGPPDDRGPPEDKGNDGNGQGPPDDKGDDDEEDEEDDDE